MHFLREKFLIITLGNWLKVIWCPVSHANAAQ